MSHSVLDSKDLCALKYVVTHVFCPLQLPDGDDHNARCDYTLAGAVSSAVRLYSHHVSQVDMPEWHKIMRMLDNLQASVQFESLDKSLAISQLRGMDDGGVVAFLIRAQNAAVVFRKMGNVTICESFEVSPMAGDVMTTQGKLICSYPGPAIEIPNLVFDDDTFLSELVNFLVHMNEAILDSAATSQKAESTVLETRDTTHPRYITELLTGILRSVGCAANIVRIRKRVGDDVVWNNSKLPWRRSSLWLLIRVVLQTSLNQSTLGNTTYKAFILFFMCSIAKENLSADLPNDLLLFMSAKISRRLRKMGTSAEDWLSHTVLNTCASVRVILENRWTEIRAAQRRSPSWNPSQLDLSQDTRLSLSNSGDYLRGCLASDGQSPTQTSFDLRHHTRGALDDFLSSNGSFFEDAYHAEPHVALYDVERAIEEGLDDWVARVSDRGQACVELEILANKYSSSALKTYANNPEHLSIMLLTTMELWVALDKIAIMDIPMLADYSPEVPTSILEQLLLCKTTSLDRLRRLYQYISHRHSQSHSGSSVFSSVISTDSFAVRFYEASSHLQNLKARIEELARREVREKAAELDRANAHHIELQQRAASTDHEYSVDLQYGFRYHIRYCSKCSFERQLREMEISVHEWPLPAERLPAEAVVFELDCPVSFNMWRSATFHLLFDLCSPSVEPQDPYIQLTGYTALQPFLVQHPRSRITLASQTKPFVVTHYRDVSIPSTQARVLVNNGLSFYGFDSRSCISVSGALCHANTRKYCTYTLPSGPYQSLQKYVDTVSHTSNEVLANQADCHNDLSIHEYMVFGHLRSGGLLQWLNILRELRGRSLSFRHEEVHFLLAQAVSQVGPLANGDWTWHQEIQHPPFCYAFLRELECLIRDVEANWLEAVTMDTISFLLRLLLASSPDQAVSLKTLELLRAVRGKVFSWVRELSAKLTKTPGDEEFRGFLRDTAAICRGTFDVNPAMVHELLHSAEDIEVLVSSAVLIHDHTPSKVTSLPIHSQLLLDRDRRLSLAIESAVRDVIQADMSDRGINLAIQMVWPAYRPGSKWTPLSNPNSRWLSCTTAPTVDQSSQTVHYNLLDGLLLVNGKPLGRLPSGIVQHPLYNVIFGEQVLDVIPSDLPGMDYSTRAKISDHQVYFSLRGDELKIRAKQTAMNAFGIIQLIPQEKLEGDLPTVLIEGHAHWFNLATSILEIRPLDHLWEASSDNWQICCTPGQYRMQAGPKLLVDIRSQSWSMVASILRPFDIPQNILITVSSIDPDRPSSLQLSVELPRYSMSFYINEDGVLESRNIRDMVYDENQCIGTLFGLVNRLVLRPKLKDINADERLPRCILIPDGRVSFQQDGHHVRVAVDTSGPALGRVTYQTYRVDTSLGCLAGTVSLTSKLYCAYLHALTSGCSTDPLTGRCGIEEALSLLRSGSCWSIIKLTPRDAELLCMIASLCPSRTWYPPNLACMQRVEWLNLPVNSQHHELHTLSKAIKEYYEKLQLFHGGECGTLFEDFPQRDQDLLERHARRAAYLFPSEFSGKPAGASADVPYSARDLVTSASDSREHRAYTAAASVYHRTANMAATTNILTMVESWGKTVSGDTSLSLRYDESWLTPNLPLIWLKAYNLLRAGDSGKWFQLLFSLPAMAYASPELGNLVPVFVAFGSHSQFRFEDPPCYASYDLTDGYCPSQATLRGYVASCAHSFECSPESSEPARYQEDFYDLKQRQRRMYNSRLESDTDTTVHQLQSSWPCETPSWISLSCSLYNVMGFMSDARAHFSSCYHNLKLKEHLGRIQSILNNAHCQGSPVPTHQYSFHPSKDTILSDTHWSVMMNQLFARPAPSLPAPERLPEPASVVGKSPLRGSQPLHRLIATAEANAISPFQLQYVSALRASAECFQSEMSAGRGTKNLPTAETLLMHYTRCRESYVSSLGELKECLGPKSQSEQALERSGQWPRITAHALFRSLASSSPILLPDDWKRCLVQLVLLALELQRARRLLLLLLAGLPEELLKELQNAGCDGWNAEAHPDWLLIQLQANLFVRRIQAEVAGEMISPRSGENTAMQLNMGEGKSSVIVPIVVSVLANGYQLVRVIVPKALTRQMFQLLVDRLSGLADRRIYFLPFSRSLKVDREKVSVLQELMLECMKERGILVVQPEHVLSLKLVSVEKQLPQQGDVQVAHVLLELQRWLRSHSRDILDESDEILHVRYQLVYTMGLQRPIEGFPDRWTTTQQVLGLVKKHASSLRALFPQGVEYERGPSGSFPSLRILHADAGRKLISQIVQDVMDGRLANFSFGQLRSDLWDAIRNFISCKDVSPEDIKLVKVHAQTPLWGGLLLLRGLLSSGILLFAFRERRWRVDYGLAPWRTMLAVPYRAKDVPAQRAEFGHPDMAILLTCLSYYYGGLSEEQLRLSFEILLKQDDPSLDYDLWVQECPAIPECLQTVSGVNVKSLEQWNALLLPHFSQNRVTIDFYLSNVVFPKEAKEFPSKLSCSGWDLVETKEHLLTGFSGTNDGRYLLPLHITQRDLDHQRGTNAKILSYLLQSENKHYMCMSHPNGERRTTREFLRILLVQQPEIRVLLDVGAQMLDLHNWELAAEWLNLHPNANAAIYFDEDDELTVRTRDGNTQLLLSSSFAQQLDQCVVYLDDAHTRGTDIKFPSEFRAAVTLGPKVTKDRLAQGCMRMRKLGHGHSIMFFAPLEIDRRIRSVARKRTLDDIDVMDILHWAIRETCDDIQQRAPHWTQQGADHTVRYAGWTGFCNGRLSAEELSNKWLQQEAKALTDLYEPHNVSNLSLVPPDIRQRLIELGILSLRDVRMDEEQEREVLHEAERERQVERPPRVLPSSHVVHQDVVTFVKTGVVPTNSAAFRPAFETLNATSTAAQGEVDVWSPHVLVTMDFESTVHSSDDMDEYLRPVAWIAIGQGSVLVILSPHEVDCLLPEIKSSNVVHLHLYTPRTAKSMEPCDDLALYSTPTHPAGWTPPAPLMDQLNVFAGQLYLKDYETYTRLCRFLCVYTRELHGEAGVAAESDGFIAPDHRPWFWPSYGARTFQSTPLGSLRALVGLRRKGMRFAPTHMGYLLDGRLLSEGDFDDQPDRLPDEKPCREDGSDGRDDVGVCAYLRDIPDRDIKSKQELVGEYGAPDAQVVAELQQQREHRLWSVKEWILGMLGRFSGAR